MRMRGPGVRVTSVFSKVDFYVLKLNFEPLNLYFYPFRPYILVVSMVKRLSYGEVFNLGLKKDLGNITCG